MRAGPRSRMAMKKILNALLPGRAAATPATKRINLALQGGGAHGAFTWGVLEQLLSDERLSIEGIFVARLIDEGRLPHGTGLGQYRRINVHRILLDRFGTHFGTYSKLSTDYDFFDMLHVSGMRAARRFLDEHFDDIGVKSTVDLRAEAQAEWA